MKPTTRRRFLATTRPPTACAPCLSDPDLDRLLIAYVEADFDVVVVNGTPGGVPDAECNAKIRALHEVREAAGSAMETRGVDWWAVAGLMVVLAYRQGDGRGEVYRDLLYAPLVGPGPRTYDEVLDWARKGVGR